MDVAQELQQWLSNITQSYGQNGERGIDIGLPYHTPVYAVTSGPVENTGYYGGGGVVSVDTPISYDGINGPASIYYQHLSDIAVQPGQQVTAGQLIGYSGGQLGYGDHPSSSAYSNGPHIEIGINGPWGTASSGLWRPQGPNVNPQGFFQALEASNGASNSLLGNPITSGGLGGVGSVATLDPATWIAAIQGAFTGPLQRMGFVFFGALVVLVGVIVLFFSDAREAGQQATEIAEQVAPEAGTAAEAAA